MLVHPVICPKEGNKISIGDRDMYKIPGISDKKGEDKKKQHR